MEDASIPMVDAAAESIDVVKPMKDTAIEIMEDDFKPMEDSAAESMEDDFNPATP